MMEKQAEQSWVHFLGKLIEGTHKSSEYTQDTERSSEESTFPSSNYRVPAIVGGGGSGVGYLSGRATLKEVCCVS